MFNVMVKSILLYGIEIWRWKEKYEKRSILEALQERYIRWILGLDRCKLYN